MSGLGNRLEIGTELARLASEACLRAFRDASFDIRDKAVGDVVTDVDLANERMIRARITAEFPGDTIFGEELGGVVPTEGFCWLIDPVDGTVNFARRVPYFCVSLGLVENGRPVAAWIADPVTGELFQAGPDRRVFCNDRPICHAEMTVRGRPVVGLGFSDRHEPTLAARMVGALEENGLETRRLGAGALCLAHAAAGRIDAYAEPHMQPWDAVAGLYLCACAGLVVQPYWQIGSLDGGGPVLVAAPSVAGRLAALLPPPFEIPNSGAGVAGSPAAAGQGDLSSAQTT